MTADARALPLLPIPYPMQPNTIYAWDALTTARTMKACEMRVNCVVTSPPYFGLRDYGVDGQIGLEQTPAAYVAALVEVFRAIRDVLADDGVLWLNLGDSYWGSGQGYGDTKTTNKGHDGSRQRQKPSWNDTAGLKPKDLMGIPWRVAFALQADGWYLRSDVIWHKPNAFPDPVKDRPTKAHEYVFLLSKQAKYFYDTDAIKEPVVEDSDVEYRKALRVGKTYDAKAPYQMNTPYAHKKQDGVGKRTYTGFNERWDNRDEPLEFRNRRSVWVIPTEPSSIPHYAMMPRALAEVCIRAGCPEGGLVFDPFMGVGTTAWVARYLKRNYIGCEIDPKSIARANRRLRLKMTPQESALVNVDFAALPLFASADVAAGGAP